MAAENPNPTKLKKNKKTIVKYEKIKGINFVFSVKSKLRIFALNLEKNTILTYYRILDFLEFSYLWLQL